MSSHQGTIHSLHFHSTQILERKGFLPVRLVLGFYTVIRLLKMRRESFQNILENSVNVNYEESREEMVGERWRSRVGSMSDRIWVAVALKSFGFCTSTSQKRF